MIKRFVTEKRNDGVMGYPCTPGRWISKKPECKNITEILITYGGGMGGANKVIFCDEISLDLLQPNTFIKVFDIQNSIEMVINTNYIVSANNNYKVATVKYDSHNPTFFGEYIVTKVFGRDVKVTMSNEFLGGY